jgi:hypothetical protein
MSQRVFRTFPLLAGILFLLWTVSVVLGRGTGITPGINMVPPDLVRNYPGCGDVGCHVQFPNSYGIARMAITPATTSITLGATIAVNVTTTGGVQNPNNLGGLCIETSVGEFIPGATTDNGRDDFNVAIKNVITHQRNWTRIWDFSFKAPGVPGRIEWFGATNTVNNDGRPDGDSWDWWQPKTTLSNPGTPFRLYVNAASVTSFGTACPGKDGLPPVIGAPVAPARGAAGFAVEVTNVPPGTVVVGIVGGNDQNLSGIPLPFDLAPLGAPGCALRTDILALQAGVAAGAPAPRGSGVASIGWPIPNDASLLGGTLFFQMLVLDAGANPGGISASAGLKAVIL